VILPEEILRRAEVRVEMLGSR